jgi:hypothetical protein
MRTSFTSGGTDKAQQVMAGNPAGWSAPVVDSSFASARWLPAFLTLGRKQMDPLEHFNKVSHFVYDEFEKANSDFSLMRPELAIFHRVQAAQGVIDNGGLVYFFENDWIGFPPYSDFVAAYRAIGCEDAARCIEHAANSFPFADPELHYAKRRKFMEDNYDADLFEVKVWDNSICGDETVYPALGTYAAMHPDAFR